jgi:hypothetical protein
MGYFTDGVRSAPVVIGAGVFFLFFSFFFAHGHERGNEEHGATLLDGHFSFPARVREKTKHISRFIMSFTFFCFLICWLFWSGKMDGFRSRMGI